MLGLIQLLSLIRIGFGGEDPLASPNEYTNSPNWHHEDLTKRAAEDSGWTADAARRLAFNADYLDSYLYSPLWWFNLAQGGGFDRFVLAMTTRDDLVKLHFDDLHDPHQAVTYWQRLAAGTVAGLVWLGHTDDHPEASRIEMAHNLIGVSLHAVQDFYSHSSWINRPERQESTWWEVAPADRLIDLYTGAYEEVDAYGNHLSPHHHGDFLFECTVLNNLGAARSLLREVLCHDLSPLATSSLCRSLHRCNEAIPFPPPSETALPPGLLWGIEGMNLDSKWQAQQGVVTRGLSLTGDEAFAFAEELAYRSSKQWLGRLAYVCHEEAGLGSFWDHIMVDGVSSEDYRSATAPWEDYSLQPYRFITAGAYPPGGPMDAEGEWFLRLTIATSNAGSAGTDADLEVSVDGHPFGVLDHSSSGPGGGLLKQVSGHNDHEKGATAAYVLGPLASKSPPESVMIHNGAPSIGGLIEIALDNLKNAVIGLFSSIGSFLKKIIGYEADFVDQARITFERDTLRELAVGEEIPFTLDMDGHSEGHFQVSGTVGPTSSTGAYASGVEWREYRVRVRHLRCIRESAWDHLSDSDEPFVLGLVVRHGSGKRPHKFIAGPYEDVDRDETVYMGKVIDVQIPAEYGFITLVTAVWESDGETPRDRTSLLNQMAGHVKGNLEAEEEGLLEAIGETIAPDWKWGAVEAVAFRRGECDASVQLYVPQEINTWVNAGEDHKIELQPAGDPITVDIPAELEEWDP